MRTLSFMFITLLGNLFFPSSLEAQDACTKNISTNHLSPYNNHPFPDNRYNPWINTSFDMGKLDLLIPARIELNNQLSWSSDFMPTQGITILEMWNPYTSDGTPNPPPSSQNVPATRYDYLHPIGLDFAFRDYKWEDGWELLWLGTGYYPNGEALNTFVPERAYHLSTDDPNHPRMPYTIMYNRYRGVMRVFSNLITPFSSYSDVRSILAFGGEGSLSGILRHLEPIDRPLDQTTNIHRIESFNPKPGNWNQWHSMDFQLGYDPCICGKNQELTIFTNGIDEFSLTMYGRGLTLDVPLLQDGQPNYDLDWLTSHDVNGGLSGGNRIFTKMDALIDDYQQALNQYQENSALYQDYSDRNAVLNAFKSFIVDGAIGLIPAGGTFQSWFLKPKAAPQGDPTGSNFSTFIKGSGKGLLGYGYDHLSMGINPKTSQPKPPDMPTASHTEMRFSGGIQGFSEPANIGPFNVPGSYDEQSALSNLSSPHRYPAYNAPPGLAATLRTPMPITNFQNSYSAVFNGQYINPALITECLKWYKINTAVEFALRFEDMQIALNPSLDWDMSRTETYVALEIELERSARLENSGNYTFQSDGIDTGTNMYYSHDIISGNKLSRFFVSKWVPISQLNQQVYALKLDEEYSFFIGGTASVPGDLPSCEWNNVSVPNVLYDLKSLKVKLLHDYFFNQIGSNGDQVNTTQVFSHILYDTNLNIDYLNNDGPWSTNTTGYFDLYIPGIITLGDETIYTNHPYVHHVDGDEIYINAQEVHISGPLQIQPGYTLIIQALEQIHHSPGAIFNPKIHMRINSNFYNTPVIEYVNTAIIESFCNGSDYQANVASRPLRERLEQELAAQALAEISKTKQAIATTLSLYPNPARSELTIQTQGAGIDRLTIFDMATRPVMQASPGGQALYRMGISGLAQGVYIVRAECGDEVLTEKLVVAK